MNNRILDLKERNARMAAKGLPSRSLCLRIDIRMLQRFNGNSRFGELWNRKRLFGRPLGGRPKSGQIHRGGTGGRRSHGLGRGCCRCCGMSRPPRQITHFLQGHRHAGKRHHEEQTEHRDHDPDGRSDPDHSLLFIIAGFVHEPMENPPGAVRRARRHFPAPRRSCSYDLLRPPSGLTPSRA